MADAADLFRNIDVGYPAQSVPAQPRVMPRSSRLTASSSEGWPDGENSMAILFGQVKERTSIALRNLVETSARVGRTARTRAVQIRTERPLELLAVVGGVAAVLGIVVRIRRSRRHA